MNARFSPLASPRRPESRDDDDNDNDDVSLGAFARRRAEIPVKRERASTS